MITKTAKELSTKVRTQLGDYAHDAWSRWMMHLFSRSAENADGTVTIPADRVKQWKRQMITPYKDLSKKEKASDLAEADKMIDVVKEAKDLTTKDRKRLADTSFALPELRKYPIPDINHARLALAMVAKHGTQEQKSRVRAAVKKKYPSISVTKTGSKLLSKLAQTFDFSSIQAALPPVEAIKVKALANQVSDEDLYLDPKDPESYGRAKHPHITVFYGLHTEDASVAQALVAGFAKIKAQTGKIPVFNCDDYDVLKIEVQSHRLHELHELIGETLTNTTTHPDYKPHITIAYVKKGRAAKYLDSLEFDQTDLSLEELEFSSRSGQITNISLNQEKESRMITKSAMNLMKIALGDWGKYLNADPTLNPKGLGMVLPNVARLQDAAAARPKAFAGPMASMWDKHIASKPMLNPKVVKKAPSVLKPRFRSGNALRLLMAALKA